jgi:hypothetical protein
VTADLRRGTRPDDPVAGAVWRVTRCSDDDDLLWELTDYVAARGDHVRAAIAFAARWRRAALAAWLARYAAAPAWLVELAAAVLALAAVRPDGRPAESAPPDTGDHCARILLTAPAAPPSSRALDAITGALAA